jgi:2-keto-4-pentenoate hydratase/2-oxohepta-3-ene-1,7-dioic acid hydratase in catechol pathway
MRFASLAAGGYGLVTDGEIRPVPRPLLARYPTLRCAIAGDALAEVAQAAAAVAPAPLDSAELAATIPDAGRILCVGMNYREHIREMGREPPAYPAMFVRYPDSLVGHGQALVRPQASRQYDYEGELAIVMGKAARRVSRDTALDYVAGYTGLMDGSIRDYQRHTSQFTAGKNFPGTGAMGPWLVTADELTQPSELTLQTRVAGETLQQGELADLCIDIPDIIVYLSVIFALQPGVVIATGTPSGVGFARDPQRWLVPGDTVEVEISGIGVLRNTVTDEA